MQGLTTSETAERAGVNVQTVRYYERRGLIPEPPRTESGYRQYGAEHVARIRFIKRAQELGFTLEEAREADVAVVNGMAFEYALGDCAASLAADGLGTRLVVVLARQIGARACWQKTPDGGTRATVALPPVAFRRLTYWDSSARRRLRASPS